MDDGPKVQFRMNYSDVEDRIVFSGVFADGSEMNLWFTRRLTLGFLGLAQKFSSATAAAGGADTATPTVKEQIASFERDAAVQQADRSTPFAEGEPHKELGKAPLLVTRVTLTPQSDTAVVLQLGLADKRLISFPVSRDTFLTLWDMLEELVRSRSGWLGSVEAPPAQEKAKAQKVLH